MSEGDYLSVANALRDAFNKVNKNKGKIDLNDVWIGYDIPPIVITLRDCLHITNIDYIQITIDRVERNNVIPRDAGYNYSDVIHGNSRTKFRCNQVVYYSDIGRKTSAPIWLSEMGSANLRQMIGMNKPSSIELYITHYDICYKMTPLSVALDNKTRKDITKKINQALGKDDEEEDDEDDEDDCDCCSHYEELYRMATVRAESLAQNNWGHQQYGIL